MSNSPDDLKLLAHFCEKLHPDQTRHFLRLYQDEFRIQRFALGHRIVSGKDLILNAIAEIIHNHPIYFHLSGLEQVSEHSFNGLRFAMMFEAELGKKLHKIWNERFPDQPIKTQEEASRG